MKRTRLLAVLAIAMVAGLLVSGCKNPIGLEPDTNIAWHWAPSPPQVFTIWAGQNQNAGTVTVWNDLTALHIKYQTTTNWWLEETHAHVATSLTGIPQKNGNPIQGKFEFKDEWSPRVQTCTYDIPFDGTWDEADTLYIATHCVVAQLDNGKYTNQQTGWSGPHEFPGSNWAKYIKFRLAKDVKLPGFQITMSARRGNTDLLWTADGSSRWIVTLSDIGLGYDSKETSPYDVWNGEWRGWCGEMLANMEPNTEYPVRLWSSIDQNLPLRFRDDAWDNINYLLNHRISDATGYDVQVAIWALRGDYEMLPPQWQTKWQTWYPRAKQMYDEAVANGNDWYPATGDWIAVILETPEEVQLCFIEVDP